MNDTYHPLLDGPAEPIGLAMIHEQFPGLPTLALSVRQPWAELIVKGVKPVENRTRRTSHRGPVLIHASLFEMSLDDWMDFVDFTFTVENCLETHPKDLKRGGIVGVADIVDCVATFDSLSSSVPTAGPSPTPARCPSKPARARWAFSKSITQNCECGSSLPP